MTSLLLTPRALVRRHVVNVVTWGVQLKAPKFSAYIASTTALDSFARIAGRETWSDGVTFTNVRLDLVRTEMIALNLVAPRLSDAAMALMAARVPDSDAARIGADRSA